MAGINTCTYVGPFNTYVPLDEETNERILVFTEAVHGFDWSINIIDYVDPNTTMYYGTGPDGWLPDNAEVFPNTTHDLKTEKIIGKHRDGSGVTVINSFNNNDVCYHTFPDTLGNKYWHFIWPPDVAPQFHNGTIDTTLVGYASAVTWKNYMQSTDSIDSNYSIDGAGKQFLENLPRADTTQDSANDLFKYIDDVPLWIEYECSNEITQQCHFKFSNPDDGNTTGQQFVTSTDCNCDSTQGAVDCLFSGVTLQEWCEEKGFDNVNMPSSYCFSESTERFDGKMLGIHYTYDIIPGCSDENSPFYNPDVCLSNDDEAYLNHPSVCLQEDCNGTPVSECVDDGCSNTDLCNQCMCGEYVINNLEYQSTCFMPGEEQLCSTDINGVYCIESDKDQCGICNGGNSDDLGCGCFGIEPTWFFLDKDFDCEINNDSIVINSGGTGDEDCDVSGAKVFCRSITEIITSETCNFVGSTPGTKDCLHKPYQPFKYVDCSNTFGLMYNGDPNNWSDNTFNNITDNSSCFYDTTGEYDISTMTGQPIQGCRDVNALNYNENATYGVSSSECEYEHNIGDVIFKLDFSSYFQLNSNMGNYEVYVNSIYGDTQELFLVDNSIFEGVIQSLDAGVILKYNYIVMDYTGTPTQFTENLTREVVIKDDIPTYIDVEFLNNYTDQFQSNKTNLPIVLFSKDVNSIRIIKDELDELINLNGGLIEEGDEYFNMSPQNPWTIHKQDFIFETRPDGNNLLEALGLEGQFWYLDTLERDKTKIKNELALYFSDNMENLYSYNTKFVELFQDFYAASFSANQTYRGISLLRENLTNDNFITRDGLYYFSDLDQFYPKTEDGSILTIDGFNWLGGDGEADEADRDPSNFIDIDNFIDWHLLTELTANKSTVSKFESVVYFDNNTNLIKILPPTDFMSAFGIEKPEEISQAPSYYGDFHPVDLTDASYTGWVFRTILDTYSLGLEDRGLFSLFNLYFAQDSGQRVISRWNELRGTILSIDNVTNQIDYYYNYLKHSFKADNKKWRHLNYDNFETYKKVIKDFKNWIINRIYWMDVNWYNIGFASGEYCNDPIANNWNPTSNFNDNSCEYYSDKTLTFSVDMSQVNHPSVERVELEIISKTEIQRNTALTPPLIGETLKNVSFKYEMNNIRNDIWEVDVVITEDESSLFYPGDTIEYRFIKHIPQVYTVETGAIEKDKSRFHIINYEKNNTLSHYFNDFVNTLTKTNLPIIKINTTNINDFGFVGDNNQNLFYCPGYIDPLSPVGQVSGWDEDEPECDALKDDLDYFELTNIQRVNYQNNNGYYGYFNNKLLCEQLTQCETNCIDGTNPPDEPKVRGFMDLIYNGENTFHTPDDEPQLSTKLGIEIRGFSSRGFPKKQYSIELQRNNTPQCDNKNGNYNLFCNGFTPEEDVRYDEDCIFTKENDYVLLGPYRDRSYVRNALSYELSKDMGNPASNSKHVEFILNGVYQGIFVMFEKPKIDKTRMDVGDTYGDDGEIQCVEYVEGACEYPMQRYEYQGLDYCCSGGYIIKVESGGEQEFFIMDDGFTKIEYYDPKNPSDVEKEFIRDKVLATQYNTTELLDTNSFADYVITQELAKNNEGYTRSQYWYVKDTEPDKFYMGYVWDFNHSYGAVKSETQQFSFKEFFAVGAVWSGYPASEGGLASTYAFLNQQSNVETLYQRWSDYRNGGILDIDNLLDRIDNISEELGGYNALTRDDGRWFYSNNQNYEAEFSYFKTWLLARISWMDMFLTAGNMFTNESTDESVWQWYPQILPDYNWDSTSIINNSSFYGTHNTDYNRRFINITLPENNKIYDIDNTEFIKFNWITSIDLAHFAKGYVHTDENGVETSGSNYITFNIINQLTGAIVHTFSSTDLYGDNKQTFPGYIWNITDLDNAVGSYYIEGRYEIINSIGQELPYETYQSVFSKKLYFSIQSLSELQGCTDTFAINFDVSAQIDDGSCKYQEDCDEKYIISRTDVDGLRTFSVNDGYNILSYPFPFASEQIKFFDVLNSSYISYDGGSFSEYDGVTAHFEGNSYSAVFINGRWKSTNTKGFDINNIKPGMGIILELQKSGIITWSIPELGDD